MRKMERTWFGVEDVVGGERDSPANRSLHESIFLFSCAASAAASMRSAILFIQLLEFSVLV